MVADIWKLWGKTTPRDVPVEERVVHPLLCHMIDVAEVVGAMWDSALGEGLRRALAVQTGLGDDDCRSALMYWAALHDLGKACPAFQRKHPPAVPELVAEGLVFPRMFGANLCYHGTVTTWALELLLPDLGMGRRCARQIASATGGHHGSWPDPGAVRNVGPRQRGDEAWDTVRLDLAQMCAALYPAPALAALGADRASSQALVGLVSGLISAADWIGSMSEYFGPAPGVRDSVSYSDTARRHAGQALADLQWTDWHAPKEPAIFPVLFRRQPWPMQQRVIELADELSEPALVIIEAPTGSGKTEAALYLADHWTYTCQQRGMYVAMPTTATSNQMHGRVTKVLERRYGGSAVPLLVHSQARWRRPESPIHLESDDGGDQDAEALSWFLPRKRSLLAPFGVGTVDQALLSVLQTRHFFVRLFGLAHKTVVFDEVHAYDTYMSTLFVRLLRWLRELGSSVVLLSATLPAKTRQELLAAYGGGDVTPHEQVPYPRVTWRVGGTVGSVVLPAPPDRTLRLLWIGRDPKELCARLSEELREGGCAAVICNTVGRAQELYQALRAAEIVPVEDLILFHARFPYAWRQEIEERVLDSFSPEGARPERAIVVATQVIEQSLDLDFDLMVTDLAPVDLVLQRAGRLHRHAEHTRPTPLRDPCLLIASDGSPEEAPSFGTDEYVYDRYTLLRSLASLWGRNRLLIPSQTEHLIGSVYGDPGADPTTSAELQQALDAALEDMRRRQVKETSEAKKRVLRDPGDESLLDSPVQNLQEDDPCVHEALRALTRLGPPSITLVCLHQTASGLSLEPEGGQRIDLFAEPWPELTRRLVEHSVSVSHRVVFNHFSREDPPVGWRQHPLLRFDRPAIFAGGVCRLDGTGYTLVLDRELGLCIVKEE